MGALPTGTTQEDFYGDSSLWGGYQYVSLADIINNFQLMYVGDDKLIDRVDRDLVIFHAKRGLQTLNYNVLQEIKAVEQDLGPTLEIVLPEDYVNYVRVSWIDDLGYFHPMITNEDTLLAQTYLQDANYNIIFDGSGNVTTAAQNTYDQTLVGDQFSAYRFYAEDGTAGHNVDLEYSNARYGLETGKANFNGWFYVDKASGVMKFSSNVETKSVVIEYISDGLESSDFTNIRVHKYAEEALYAYIEWQILSRKFGIQEYIVRRKHKYYHIQYLKAKSMLSGLTYDDLFQTLRTRDKIIK